MSQLGVVDNDGDMDIAMVSNSWGDYVYINNGVDAFTRIYLGTGEHHRVDVVLVDFDDDGDLDFSWGSGGMVNNNGVYEATSNLAMSLLRAVVFADFNGDGYPDAAGHGFMDNTGAVVINQQGQGFQFAQSLNRAEYYGADASDIDNDGDIDISVGDKIWLNNGAGVFADSGISLSTWGDREFCDINNDGYVDLVIATGGGCYVMLNDGNGDFVRDGKRTVGTFGYIAVGDIDGDGYADIVIANPFYVYLNDGSGGFDSPAYMNPSAGTNAPSQDVEVADLNGDGRLDIIVSDWKPSGFNGLATPKVFYQIATQTAIWALHISSTAGGSVIAPGEGSHEYSAGSIIVVQAEPHAGYDFVNWTGTAVTAGKVADTTSASTTLTLDGDYTLVANFNQPPIANAGTDLIDCSGMDGIAQVTLDGSASNDPEDDELTYSWTWTIDGDVYEATSVNPTIELPMGTHIIQLVVNDGTQDSEPDEVTIDVFGPVPVDDLVDTSLSQVRYDRRTRQYSMNVTITNTSAREIGSPVCLAMESISNPAVTLADCDGTTLDGKQYIDLSGLLGDDLLDPGESISTRIFFNNPTRARFICETSVRGLILP